MRSLSIESSRELAAVSKAMIVRETSDEELIIQVQENHPDALRELFRRYSKMVFIIALRILRDRGEAEELVQDVFVHLFQRGRQFDPARGTAKTWIIQISYHRALDRKAYLERRAFYVSTDITDELNTLTGEADLDGAIGDREDIARIRAAFETLSDEQRLTLQLHFLSGLELREIAFQLNDSLGNVRHYFYRGLSRLRKHATVQMLQRERQSSVRDMPKSLQGGTAAQVCS